MLPPSSGLLSTATSSGWMLISGSWSASSIFWLKAARRCGRGTPCGRAVAQRFQPVLVELEREDAAVEHGAATLVGGGEWREDRLQRRRLQLRHPLGGHGEVRRAAAVVRVATFGTRLAGLLCRYARPAGDG